VWEYIFVKGPPAYPKLHSRGLNFWLIGTIAAILTSSGPCAVVYEKRLKLCFTDIIRILS